MNDLVTLIARCAATIRIDATFRLSAAGQIGGLCGRHPAHPGHRGCDLAGIPWRPLYANGVRRRPWADRVAGHPVAVAGKSDCAIPPAFPAVAATSSLEGRGTAPGRSRRDASAKVPGPFNQVSSAPGRIGFEVQLSRCGYSDQQLALDSQIPAESARDSNAGTPFLWHLTWRSV